MKIKILKKDELELISAGGQCNCFDPSETNLETWNGIKTFHGCATICCQGNDRAGWSFSWVDKTSSPPLMTGVCYNEKPQKPCYSIFNFFSLIFGEFSKI